MNIGVIGLGYVGLPLAVQFASHGNYVTGFDVDPDKIASINTGHSYIRDIDSTTIASLRFQSNFLSATSDFDKVAGMDALIICVPTPLTKHREPDIRYITDVGNKIAPFLKAGQLVVLESTTYPGTTDEDLLPILERGSNLKAGKDFFLAFSPEREDPGNSKFKTGNIPKVVGGLTDICRQKTKDLYASAGINVVPVSSNRAAEATKLLENIFRCVNIALVNELKVVFDKMDIDVWEVINAAKTKPFGFMPFYPGPGLGGHCIPIDPFYLTWKAREFGAPTKFIELAGEINTEMPHYVVEKIVEGLSKQGKPLNRANVLLLGMAYKKDVEDVRESPSFAVWEILDEGNAIIGFHDPFVSFIPRLAEHLDFAGYASLPLTQEELEKADAVVILTDHTAVDYKFVAEHAKLIVDTRNACKDVDEKFRGKIIKA